MRQPQHVGYALPFAIGLLIIALTLIACAAPLVQITRPADKEIISGSAEIQVTYGADGSSPIVRLELYIDGRLVEDLKLKQPTVQGLQVFRWDFALATPSVHSISAKAVDASGAVGSTGIKVMVQRREQPASAPSADRTPPRVDILSPQEGQVVRGELQVKADASDDSGIRTVVFFLDGKLRSMIVNSPNYSTKFDTRQIADGTHVVSVSAWDLNDNEAQSEPRSFIVRNNEATTPQTGETRISRTPEATLAEPGGAPGPDMRTPPAPPASGSAKEIAPSGPAPAGTGEARTPTGPPNDLVAKATIPTGSAPTRAMAQPPRPSEPLTSPASTRPLEAPAPQTSPLVASLPLQPATAASTTLAPAPDSMPLAAVAGSLPPEPGAAPQTRTARLTTDDSAATLVPPTAEPQPKTSTVTRAQPVVLATPTPTPDAGRMPAEATGPRPSRVAALPARGADDEPAGKMGRPGALDVASMARFQDVKVVFDGKLVSLRAAPLVLSGVSIAPLREIFERTDGVLYWYHVEKRVKAVNDQTEIELQIGDKTAKVNGNERGLAVAPFIKNGRTMVPLEFIAQSLDVTIAFNSDTGELVITSNKF
jgi:Copper amine oxidase N-terminal domain/Bacterial Ig domain